MPRDGELPTTLDLHGTPVPLDVQWNTRARKLTITVDHTQRQVRLVLPRRVSLKEGIAFCRKNADWIQNRLAALPSRVPFAHGSLLPLLGEAHRIHHVPEARRGVWREAGAVWVSGQAEFLERRVTAFLRELAEKTVGPMVRDKAQAVERRVGRVTLRESRTRWGSCSPSGDLSFCWRLIFAPAQVLDYVVAHEVAHLVHLNHSERFWKLCAQLTPEVQGPRRWLMRHGQTLWRYG
jgi:predicted metal-dependent hydrolase